MSKKKKKSNFKELFKNNFSKICLVMMFFMVLVYTAVVLWIFAHIGTEPSTLTVSFFALMTGECGMLALIKNTKTKHGDEENRGEEESDGEYHG